MPPPDNGDDLIAEILDPSWYRARYPDIAAAGIDPLQHFIRHGVAERRDPNRFFDSAWYTEHYPDVAASGMHPLTHYLQAGAAEQRNPHPRFDAAYYAGQHPDARSNPLLYHLRIGVARGYLTEAAIDIRDYLPSEDPTWPVPAHVLADVVVPVRRGLESTRPCITSIMADRRSPLGRIIIIDDCSSDRALTGWLRQLADAGQIHLIHNRSHLGFTASAAIGIDAAGPRDAVLLRPSIQLPQGWLYRLAGHAYSCPDIATASPLRLTDDELAAFDVTFNQLAQVCRSVNARRGTITADPDYHCLYLRRTALDVTPFAASSAPDATFSRRVTAAGWQHKLAFDTFVLHDDKCNDAVVKKTGAYPTCETSSRFALTAALLRQSKLPVILMITHDFGGGVRRHIDTLINRYRDSARILLLSASDRGAVLSVPLLPNHPTLTLPADRLDDLVTVLRSMNVRRVHIHHLLRMDMDIQTLIHRLAVPFDVTVHDYFAICPQIHLLRWPEGLYCGEPAPAECNACIASQSSHGARDIISWRRSWAWQFIDADRVICPSANVKARLGRHGLADRAIIVPHERQQDVQWLSNLPSHQATPLRIALLGVLANHKGARTVAEVAAAAASGTIEIHLAGHWEAAFPGQAAKLIKATGPYQDADLPNLLRRINPHVFWFPSSAPETYSFTLGTAIATGLPIVACDLGSFRERLAGRPLTWLVDHRATAEEWLRTFKAVKEALDTRPKVSPAPRVPALCDFYAEQYLAPMSDDAITAPGGRRKAAPGSTGQPRSPRRRGSRTPKIAIVPERHDTGGLTPCAYIRLLQPFDHLATGSRFDIILADAETVFDHDADIIVTQRHAVRSSRAAARVADHARRSGARLLFDLDDDLMNVPVTHPDAPELRPLAKTVRRMLTIADAVWVSTPALSERLASVRPNAMVMENRLDQRIWTHQPALVPFQDDPVRILCMGTSTHDRDFAMIEPALLRLKAEYGERIEIDILGMTGRTELPPALNRISPPSQASRSYPGFVNWLTGMQPGWHIGLAPLLDTTFNRGKSPIKAMDYAAMGMAVVASDTPVYRGSLADGPAGQLAANDHHAWHAALDWLIRDQDLRRATGMRARQAFLNQATLANDEPVRRKALEDLLAAACRRARAR